MKSYYIFFIFLCIFNNSYAQNITQVYQISDSNSSFPVSIVSDLNGNVYSANQGTNSISKISATGIVSSNWIRFSNNTTPIALIYSKLGYLLSLNSDNTISKISTDGNFNQTWATINNTRNQISFVEDNNGNIFTLSHNGKINKISNTAVVTNSWAVLKDTLQPLSIVINKSTGTLYVLNGGNKTISKISNNGVVTNYWLYLSNIIDLPGTRGIGDMVIDNLGNIFISLQKNLDHNAIIKILPNATIQPSWVNTLKYQPLITAINSQNEIFTSDGSTVSKISSSAQINNNYSSLLKDANPLSFCFDNLNNLYSANNGNNTISKISNSGEIIQKWASLLQDAAPGALVVDANNNIFTANSDNGTVSKIANNGLITPQYASFTKSTTSSEGVVPNCMSVDGNQNLFISNTRTGIISKINATGNFIESWASLTSTPEYLSNDNNGNLFSLNIDGSISKINASGSVINNWAALNRNFDSKGMAIDAVGNIYITNYFTNTVSKITASGTTTNSWAILNNNSTNPASPIGIVVDRSGNVYTANSGDNTISKITSQGVTTQNWAFLGEGASPSDLLVDNNGNLFVYNYGLNTISKINPNGLVTNAWFTFNPAYGPMTIGIDQNNNIFAASYRNNTVSKITSPQIIAPSSLDYGNSRVLVNGVHINNISPTSLGSPVIKYTITPTLPVGLSFSASTGIISGTPSQTSMPVNYIITAINDAGTASTTFSISVIDVSPTNLNYSQNNIFTLGTSITNLVPSINGVVTNYSINPSLPSGLSINTLSGVISGTPTVLAPSSSYTITATNSAGSVNFNINISVIDVAPSRLIYNSTNNFLAKGSVIANITPSNLGGTITNYAITPSLPSGLAFNSNTGVISGNPTVNSTTSNYTITAYNSGGNTSANISITIYNAIPLIINPVSNSVSSGIITVTYIISETFVPNSKRLTISQNGNTINTISLRDNDNGSVNLNFKNLMSSISQINSYTGNNILDDGSYNLSISYNDQSNNLVRGSSVNFLIDTYTLQPSLNTPSTGNVFSGPIPISLSLPETNLNGSIKLTFIGSGTYSNTLILKDNSLIQNFNLNPSAVLSSNVLFSTYPNLPDGFYDVILSYQDIYGHPASSNSATNIKLQNRTPIPSITNLTNGSVYSPNSNFVVNYTLPSSPFSGTARLTLDPGYTYDISSLIGANSYTITSNLTPNDGTYSATISYQDYLGNPVASSIPIQIIFDSYTNLPNILNPISNLAISGQIPVSLTLGEVPSLGTAKLTFTNSAGTYSNVLSLSNNTLSQNFTLTTNNLTSNSFVSAATYNTIPDGIYDISLSYQDVYNNPVSTSVNANITIQTATPAPIITSPISGTVFNSNNAPIFSYNIPSAPLSGTAVLTLSPGGYTYNLPNQSGSGTYTITSNMPSEGTYTATVSYQDYLGNPAASSFVQNIIFDFHTNAINLISPTTGTQFSSQIPVSLTFGEVPAPNTAKLIFTNTTGTYSNTLVLANSTLSQSFTLTTNALRTSPFISSSTNSTLPDGIYNISISYQDAYLNPVATVISSNVLIQTLTPQPSLTSPTNGYVFNSHSVPAFTYNLPSTPLSGTAVLTLSPGGYTYNLANQAGSGTYTITSNIPADGTYTVTVGYQDYLSNPISLSSPIVIYFKRFTPLPKLISPANNASISSNLVFKDSIYVPNLSGTKILSISKDNALITTIVLNNTLSDSINFNTHHLSLSNSQFLSINGADSLGDGRYIIKLSYQDIYQNPIVSTSDTINIDTTPLIGTLSHQDNIVFGPFTETLTFNKPVDLISNNGIIPNTINNNPSASIGTLIPNSNKTIYNFSVTPLQQGILKLQSPNMGIAVDIAGNLSQVIAIDSVQYVDTTQILTPLISGLVSFCNGDSVTLTSSIANTYLWSTGATTRSIIVKQGGVYNVKTNYDNHVKGVSNNLTITSNPIPNPPTISRDANNNLVSSAKYGNFWYLNGLNTNDTSVSIKPSQNGPYSARTVQLGCASAMGPNYYYVITDIENISATEFIKVSPNPFAALINTDFIIKGNQYVNLTIFDINTGNIVATKEKIMAGSNLQLPYLVSGIYIFRFSSADGKITKQFKMVKL